MDSIREKIVVIEAEAEERERLRASMETAGYDVFALSTAREGLDAVRSHEADLIVLGAAAPDPVVPSVHEILALIRGAAITYGVRVILLVNAGPEERAAGLDFGADDAISRPWDRAELLARVRAQLHVRRDDKNLLEKMHIAEEGQQIAHTAFDALAVTETMANNAVSLNRWLKIGVGAVFAVAVLMAGTYFLFAHSAQKDMQRTTTTIARLERGITRQQDVMSEARKLRQVPDTDATVMAGKDELQKHAADIQAKLASANSDEGTALRKELDDTNSRLKRIEQQGDSAANLIRVDVDSVCLLHVSVAFRSQQNGLRLRYAGLNQQGEPLEDSAGNPVLTLQGSGPEVKVDVFGTGFPVGADGRIITNRHVAEPWWNNDELSDLTSQGYQAEISSIHAYFPGDPRAFNGEIEDISKNADLATMRIDLQNLKRPILSIDSTKSAAVIGQPVVLMGYATGLAAILARTDEDTAQKILTQSGGDVTQVLGELARRSLIHPLITQGHIGDILPDKIVFDAQTTSGGSGGPLFNQDGKVIGVTYAILKGFGGSNFGIPIRLSEPLLVAAGASD